MKDSVLHIVLLLFDRVGGIVGGAERYVLELARHMATVLPTRLVAFGPEERRETMGDLEIQVLRASRQIRGQRNNPWSSELFSLVTKAKITHCHQKHIVASSLMALWGRLVRRRIFVTDYGGGGWDLSAYLSTDRWYRGELHISEYSRGLNPESSSQGHVILGGVDTTKFAPDPTVRSGNTLLFVGRILPHKGIDVLIEAAEPDMEIEILGQPYDQRYLEDLRKLAVGKRVTFRHDSDDALLLNAYRKARVVILPSVYRDRYGVETPVPELLGQTLLEGMACGRPVIGTNVASIPEVVMHGRTGFLVPPNDPIALRQKLRWLLDHPSDAEAMGVAARQHVMEKFTWPEVVRRCLTIYGVGIR